MHCVLQSTQPSLLPFEASIAVIPCYRKGKLFRFRSDQEEVLSSWRCSSHSENSMSFGVSQLGPNLSSGICICVVWPWGRSLPLLCFPIVKVKMIAQGDCGDSWGWFALLNVCTWNWSTLLCIPGWHFVFPFGRVNAVPILPSKLNPSPLVPGCYI